MNITLCVYSLMLCMLAFFAYKNELGISIPSMSTSCIVNILCRDSSLLYEYHY